MTDSEEPVTFDPPAKKKKSRKSVAFSEESLSNGDGEERTTAEKHSIDISRDDLENPSTEETLQDTEEPLQDTKKAPEAEAEADGADLFKGLKKKKKSKDKENKEGEEGVTAEGGEFDITLKKKKKKKVLTTGDSFEAKLAEAGLAQAEGEDGTAAAELANPADAGDPIAGTGVWSSNSEAPLGYPLLLSRFFTLLRAQHPDLAGDGRLKAYKIPPPQVLREGNRKTIFANISEICKKMKRHDDHVTQFLFAELGTSGSVDGSKRLVIKGRFQQKQLENVLRRYILEYVTCRTCKSPDTELKKGENRLYFVTCNICGSRVSVSTIKTGFQATVGKRRKAQA